MRIVTNKLLQDVMPYEMCGGEYHASLAYKMRAVPVTHEFRPESGDPRWPGAHKNVVYYVLLENDYVVGWNENRALGWSFPAQKISNEVRESLINS